MGPFRVYRALKGVLGPLGFIGPLSVYGPFRVYGAL